MNYILYHYQYSGNKYMEMIHNSMTESCDMIAKHGENDWQIRTQESKTWTSLKSIMAVLRGKNKVINWGNHIFSDDDYFALNRPSKIAHTSNKSKARKILQDAGVSVPKTYFWDNIAEILDGKDVEFPLIARPPKHLKGHDFFVIESLKDFLEVVKKAGNEIESWYFSEVFHKTNEFRVHVAHGKVLLINEKSFVDGNLMQTSEVNSGHWSVLNWSDFIPQICQQAIRATETLGLDYAAVDVMWNSKEKVCQICELNTDPDVGTPYVSGKYAAYFDWLIRHDFPQHFPLTSGTNVFYTEMLRE